MRLFILLWALAAPACVYAQGNPAPFHNRVILKHYTRAELQQMQAEHPEKFTYVKYLFIHSFKATPIACTQCRPFDLKLVDIREFEHLRLQDSTVTHTDSTRGFTITLCSRQQLDDMVRAATVQPAQGIRKAAYNGEPANAVHSRKLFYVRNRAVYF